MSEENRIYTARFGAESLSFLSIVVASEGTNYTTG